MRHFVTTIISCVRVWHDFVTVEIAVLIRRSGVNLGQEWRNLSWKLRGIFSGVRVCVDLVAVGGLLSLALRFGFRIGGEAGVGGGSQRARSAESANNQLGSRLARGEMYILFPVRFPVVVVVVVPSLAFVFCLAVSFGVECARRRPVCVVDPSFAYICLNRGGRLHFAVAAWTWQRRLVEALPGQKLSARSMSMHLHAFLINFLSAFPSLHCLVVMSSRGEADSERLLWTC